MSRRTIVSEFRESGTTEKSDHLVSYLEYVDGLPEIRGIKERSYEFLCLRKGSVVLDAGCGPGYDTLRMAGRVSHSGSVVGIDISEKMISLAREAAAAYDLPISFRVGNLRNMDIPDASFDAVRIERTLQILDTPGQVMDELVRVLRPSGRLVAIEPDWDTFIIDPGDGETVRKFFHFCNDQFPDGSTGRKLRKYFMERNLRNVTVHPEPLVMHDLESVFRLMNMEQFLSAAEEKGFIPREEIDLWQREMKSAFEKNQFTFAGMIFMVSGQK